MWIIGLVGPIAAIVPNGMAVLFILLGLSVIVGEPATRRLAGVPRAVILPLVGLLVWGYATIFWAPDLGLAAFTLTRLVFAIYAGLAIVSRALALAPAELERVERFFLAGYFVGLAILCVEIASQTIFGLSSSLYVKFHGLGAAVESFLNRPKTLFSILLPLAISICWRRYGLFASAILVGACIAVFVPGESLASAMGLFVAAGGAVAAAIFGRHLGSRIAAAFLVSAFLFAPLIARIAAISEYAQRDGIKASIFHRTAIWRFVSDRIFEKPFFGWGMEASRNIPHAHDNIREFMEYLPLHPHNAPLQFWLELGAIGAILAAALAAALALRCSGSLARRMAVMPTFLTAVFVACVSYGLWQGWWYTSLWVIGTLATIVGRSAERPPHHIG